MLSLKARLGRSALEIDLIFVDDSPSLSSVLTELLQRAEAAERSKHIPAGMRILPEDERLKTLEVLEQSKGDVEARLGELPIAATDNQVVQRRKAELEVKLGEIEDALKIFARKTVLVRE